MGASVVVEVSGWRGAGKEPHFRSRFEAALHVDTLVVVFELRLTSKNHQKELFIRVVAEPLAIGADIDQVLAIHQVDDASEVSGVAADTVRCPGEDAVEFSSAYLVHNLVEDRPRSGLFGRMRLALNLYNFQFLLFSQSEHLLDLAIYREYLLFLRFRRFPRVQAVSKGHSFHGSDCRPKPALNHCCLHILPLVANGLMDDADFPGSPGGYGDNQSCIYVRYMLNIYL